MQCGNVMGCVKDLCGGSLTCECDGFFVLLFLSVGRDSLSANNVTNIFKNKKPSIAN